MELKKEKENFFRGLIRDFKKQNIEYVFLRGHEFIFNRENYGEIDIMIYKKDLKRVRCLFNKIKYSRKRKENIDLTHPLFIRIVQDKFIFDLDFQIGGIAYCGSPILKEDFLLKNKRKINNFYELDEFSRFLMLFIHGFVFKKRLKYFKKYEKEFFELYKKINKKELNNYLKEFFGEKLQKRSEVYLENRDLERLFKLRKNFVLKHLSKNLKDIAKVIVSKFMRFRNYFKLGQIFYFINIFKFAPLISFIGIDGSGKTTLSEMSKRYLLKYNLKTIIVSGSVFSHIKNPFSKKIIKTENSEKKFVNYKNEGVMKILLRLFLQIPKQLKIIYYRKKGYIVITDRYVYDLINFYGARGFIKKLIKIFFQKPTKTFFIKNDVKDIVNRKQELTEGSIKKFQEEVEKNKDFLDLIIIKNKILKNTENKLKNYLEEIIKNV